MRDVDITLHWSLPTTKRHQPTLFAGLANASTSQQKHFHHLRMGSASSVLSEAGRALDGSDIQTADEALDSKGASETFSQTRLLFLNHGSFTGEN